MDAYVTVLDLNSDAVLHSFGPLTNASAGRLLAWHRAGDPWRAELAPHAYLVPVDPLVDQNFAGQ